MNTIVDRLLTSKDPSIRYKTRVGICGQNPHAPDVVVEREAIRSSETVAQLLSPRQADGRIPGSPYCKFTGAHWVLALLADLQYPQGDTSLLPLRDQVYASWLSKAHVSEGICADKSA